MVGGASGRFSSAVRGSRELSSKVGRDREYFAVQPPPPIFDAQSPFSDLLLSVLVPELGEESLFGSA